MNISVREYGINRSSVQLKNYQRFFSINLHCCLNTPCSVTRHYLRLKYRKNFYTKWFSLSDNCLSRRRQTWSFINPFSNIVFFPFYLNIVLANCSTDWCKRMRRSQCSSNKKPFFQMWIVIDCDFWFPDDWNMVAPKKHLCKISV